jgi:Carboxypeptidase regulatory-like domain
MRSGATPGFLALMMVASAGLLSAQTRTGTINGTVTDESGAVMPGVTVTLNSEALITGTSATTTDQEGNYRFVALLPGSYDLKFELGGFVSTARTGIRVESSFVATVNAVLTVGGVQETVTVSGASPIVDTTSNVISTRVDRNLLDNIPSGRDIWVIAEQVPGVVQDRYNVGGTESAQQSSGAIHGASAQQEFQFDGLTNNWPGGTGGFVMVYFDYDSFEEVQVVTNAAPAEVGTAGLFMNMVTKSGGNDFHGSATFLYEPGAWQSNNVSPELEALGVKTSNPVEHILNFAPTLGGPIMRNKAWFFGSYLRYDINTQVLGVTRPDGSPALDVNHQTNALGKVTSQVTPNNRVMGMYYFNYQNRFYRRAGFNFVSEEASWRQIEPAHIVQGQWTSALPRNMLLEARLGYVTHVFPLAEQPGLPANAISRIDDITSTMTGAANTYHWHTAPRTQVNTALSRSVPSFLGARHDFKIGGDYSRQHTYYDRHTRQDIELHYRTGVPAYVMLRRPIQGQYSGTTTASLFLQDSIAIGRLTINPGIRFEYFNGYNPAQGSPAGIYFPATQFSEVKNVPDWKNVLPRLGVTFDLTGDRKTALKAAYNHFTQQEGGRLPEALNLNSPITETRNWSDTNGNNLAELAELGPVTARTLSPASLEPDTTRPLVREATAGIDRELGPQLGFSATYYYRKNHNWLGRINRAVPLDSFTPVTVRAPDGTTITAYNQDPATLGRIDRLITNIPEFYENYHGVEMTARKRLANRWQMLAGYTVGRHKGFLVEGIGTDANDPNNLINVRDRVHGQDRTHIVKFQGSYILPLDILFSGNYRYYTGQPLTRTFQAPLNQGFVSIPLETRGTFRYPNVSILDLRASKVFKINNRSLEAMIDLFNALNAGTVTNQVTTLGSSYGRPSRLLSPRIVGFGARFKF